MELENVSGTDRELENVSGVDMAIFEAEKELAEGGKAVEAREFFEKLEEKYGLVGKA